MIKKDKDGNIYDKDGKLNYVNKDNFWDYLRVINKITDFMKNSSNFEGNPDSREDFFQNAYCDYRRYLELPEDIMSEHERKKYMNKLYLDLKKVRERFPKERPLNLEQQLRITPWLEDANLILDNLPKMPSVFREIIYDGFREEIIGRIKYLGWRAKEVLRAVRGKDGFRST